MTKKRHMVKNLVLEEVSGVTIPAQSHALVSLWKTEGLQEITKYLATDEGAKSFNEFAAEEARMKRNHEINEDLWPLIYALRDSIASIRIDDTLSDEQKEEKIAVSVAQFSTSMQRPGVSAISLDKLLTKLHEVNMSDDNKVTALEKQVEELTKKLADAEVINKMTAKEREYMASLDKEAAEEFRAAAKEERDAMMKKSAESDEMFKSADGREIRKSAVGEDVYAILKSQDEVIKATREEMVKAAERAQTVELTKVAETEYNSLPGETVEKVAVLKSMATMDDAARTTLETMLKAGQAAIAKGFTSYGVQGGKPQDVTKSAKLEAEIKKLMDADTNLTKAQAEVKVISANPDLYEG